MKLNTFLILFALIVLNGSCRLVEKTSTTATTIDTVEMQNKASHSSIVVKIDSVYIYQKDSVFVEKRGDTVFLNNYKILFKDRLKIDTIRVVDSLSTYDRHLYHHAFYSHNKTKVETSQSTTFWQRIKSWFWGAIIGLGFATLLLIVLKLKNI